MKIIDLTSDRLEKHSEVFKPEPRIPKIKELDMQYTHDIFNRVRCLRNKQNAAISEIPSRVITAFQKTYFLFKLPEQSEIDAENKRKRLIQKNKSGNSSLNMEQRSNQVVNSQNELNLDSKRFYEFDQFV